MHILYLVLEIINYVIIGICTVSFLFQIVMILFFWLKEKKFKESDKYNKIAILICARNEEDVIDSSINHLLNNQDYPRDKYDIFVVANNCTDNTYKVAKKINNIYVYEMFDDNPKHQVVAYPMKYGIDKILEKNEYDFVIRIDADNHLSNTFLKKMNDAYNEGVEIARPFEGSLNPTQNLWTQVSATYYYRDSKIASNFRERLHLDSMLNGCGMMISTKVLKECNSWDAFTSSEDAEFTLNRLLENKRVHYVAEAIVYEDQPSTMKDTFNRLTRMGHGINEVFFKRGFNLLGHFFVSLRWSNIDLFVQLLMIPVSVLCCLWFPAYYIFYIIIHLINGLGPEVLNGVVNIFNQTITAQLSLELILNQLLPMIGIVLGSFIIIYPLQTFLALYYSKEKLNIKSLKEYTIGILLSPLFMIFYAIAITIGVLTKPKWKKINRNLPSKK